MPQFTGTELCSSLVATSLQSAKKKRCWRSKGEAPELGACCVAASKLRRSSGAWSLLQRSKQAPKKLRSLELIATLQQAPELALQQNAYLGKKNEHCDFKKMFTWVLRGSGSSRSKLEARSKLQARSRSKPAPSSKLAPAQRQARSRSTSLEPGALAME
ncbi:unnamed protein product [Sphagnum balticum]